MLDINVIATRADLFNKFISRITLKLYIKTKCFECQFPGQYLIRTDLSIKLKKDKNLSELISKTY